MPSTVLDASALLAWIFNERGADIVEESFDGAHINAVNLAEVLYRCDEEGADTDGLIEDLIGIGIAIEPFAVSEAEHVQQIRRLCRDAHIRISLADACCLATARRLGAEALLSDAVMEAADVGVPIRRFR